MKPVARLMSRVNGQYYTHVGDNYVWLPVLGKVTKVSQKVLANGMGFAHIISQVIMYTKNGPKKMRVVSVSKKVMCEKGGAALLMSRVVGPRFRQGKITGNCSQKISAI